MDVNTQNNQNRAILRFNEEELVNTPKKKMIKENTVGTANDKGTELPQQCVGETRNQRLPQYG